MTDKGRQADLPGARQTSRWLRGPLLHFLLLGVLVAADRRLPVAVGTSPPLPRKPLEPSLDFMGRLC